MRIAIGGIYHETNCFAKDPTPVSAFGRWKDMGQSIISAKKDTRTYLGGLIAELEAQNAQIICAMDASAMPSGIIEKAAAEAMTQRLVDNMWQAHLEQPLDGIALNLHGAGVAQDHPDLEGYVLQCVRDRFGMDMPLGIAMDLHGNITKEMIELSDVAVGVKSYPHVDEYEAARSVAGLVCDMVKTGKKPCQRLIKLPWYIVSAAGVTLSGPAAKVRQACLDMMESGQVLQASFFHGFPYADTQDTAVSVVTVAESQQAADEAALTLARYAWSLRKEFVPKVYGAEEAVEEALRHQGLVVIGESSDNPGGGAPGDGTYLLRAMLKQNQPGSVFMGIWDREVVEKALTVGKGGTMDCLLGGKTDDLHGEPLELKDVLIQDFSDGKCVCKSVMGAGDIYSFGDTVLLKAGNVHIIVVSKRRQPKDDGLMEMFGLDYSKQRMVAVKSSHHFKAWWKDHCDTIINADPPGIHCADLNCFQFKHSHTDYYPLQDATWEEG